MEFCVAGKRVQCDSKGIEFDKGMMLLGDEEAHCGKCYEQCTSPPFCCASKADGCFMKTEWEGDRFAMCMPKTGIDCRIADSEWICPEAWLPDALGAAFALSVSTAALPH